MKILVTGTAGFIGFHLANTLLEEGHRVTGLDSVNDYYDVQLKIDRLKQAGIILPEPVTADETANGGKPAGEMPVPGTSRDSISGSQTGVEPGPAPGSVPAPVQSTRYENYRFVRLSLEDRHAVADLFEREQFDVVIHLAAQAGVRYSLVNPHAYTDSNITGFLNILEGCRHNPVRHLIYASSSSVYGANTRMPFSTRDNVDHPVSLYAASKKANELMAHTYAHLYGVPSTGLRFFTVYGPWGRPDMALFLFTKAILEGRPIDVYNHGQMERDFTYIDDIVESIRRLVPKPPQVRHQVDGTSGSGDTSTGTAKAPSGAVETPSGTNDAPSGSGERPGPETGPATSHAPYRIFNIGNNSPVRLMDFIAEIEKQLGITAEKNLMDIQPGDVPKTWADVTDLFDYINYRPSVPVGKGVAEFVRWYRDYYGY